MVKSLSLSSNDAQVICEQTSLILIESYGKEQ